MFGKKEKASDAVSKAKPAKKKGKKKKIIAALIVLVILGGAFAFLHQGSDEDSLMEVSAGTVEIGDLQNTVSIKGTVTGSESADVYSSENLTISKILVKEGDFVRKDQTLALLDTSSINDQYKIRQVELDDARRTYENAKTLYEGGAMSKTDFDKAETDYKTAQLNLSASDTSEKGVVKSPISGTVTRVNCTVGRIAGDTNAKEAMFVIENVENLKMEVKVEESDISTVKVGQAVEISADVLGKETVKGTVSHIAPTGEKKESGNGMVIPVTIDVDKGDTNLIAGVTAKAVINTDSRQQVLTLPTDAVFEDPSSGKTYVFVIKKDSTVKKIPVTIGLEGDFNVEVLEGSLKQGTQVVLSPDIELKSGSKVLVL